MRGNYCPCVHSIVSDTIMHNTTTDCSNQAATRRQVVVASLQLPTLLSSSVPSSSLPPTSSSAAPLLPPLITTPAYAIGLPLPPVIVPPFPPLLTAGFDEIRLMDKELTSSSTTNLPINLPPSHPTVLSIVRRWQEHHKRARWLQVAIGFMSTQTVCPISPSERCPPSFKFTQQQLDLCNTWRIAALVQVHRLADEWIQMFEASSPPLGINHFHIEMLNMKLHTPASDMLHVKLAMEEAVFEQQTPVSPVK